MTRLQNSNLPFINLSKENLFLMCDMLELDEIGVLMTAIKDYLYEGTEPSFNSKPLKSVWNQVIMLIDRKADSYFTRKEQMEKINSNKKQKKDETKKEEVSTVQETQPQQVLPTVNIPTELEVPTTEQNMEEEYKDDDYSEYLNKFLDDNEKPLNEMIENIFKYKYLHISIAEDAYEIALTRYMDMCNQMPTEKDRENFETYFNSRLNSRKEFYKSDFKNVA